MQDAEARADALRQLASIFDSQVSIMLPHQQQLVMQPTLAELRVRALRELAVRLPRAGIIDCLQKLAVADQDGQLIHRAGVLVRVLEELDDLADLRHMERRELAADDSDALYEIRRRAKEAEIELLIQNF